MKSRPDVEVLTVSDSGPGASASPQGADSDKVWTISGCLLVREEQIDGDSHDRPLKGVEVKVSASDLGADGPWTQWGTARTDADGRFSLSETNNGKDRFLRVQARLLSSDLEVEDATIDDVKKLDVTDTNWRTVWKSGNQLAGPAVSVGTRVCAPGQPYDLGDLQFRRQALIWYVLRSAIDRLEAEDRWFGFDGRVVAIYPARPVLGGSYQNTATRRLCLQQGEPDVDWHPDVALHFLMLMWHDLHTHGSRKIMGYPSAAFAKGFAAFASNAMLHELWGTRLDRPLNRRAVAAGLALSTLEEIERDETGSQNALRVLRCGARQGWWSHRFGTAQAYPDGRPDDDGDGRPDHPDEVGIKYRLDGREVPDGLHHLSLWDILRAFRATPAQGWNTDLQVGDPHNGVLDFIERALDIHGLGDDVRQMLERSIDPLATDEPFESLPQQ